MAEPALMGFSDTFAIGFTDDEIIAEITHA